LHSCKLLGSNVNLVLDDFVFRALARQYVGLLIVLDYKFTEALRVPDRIIGSADRFDERYAHIFDVPYLDLPRVILCDDDITAGLLQRYA
jgi:hypothetical protein